MYPKNKDTREYFVTDVGKVLTPSIKGDLTRFLDAENTASVSNLVTMCFKMRIYSSQDIHSSAKTERDVDAAVNELSGEPVLKCSTCERKLKHCFIDSVFPKVVENAPSGEQMREDLEKSRFLGVNFQHLDCESLNASVIANCRDHRNLLNIFLSCLDGNESCWCCCYCYSCYLSLLLLLLLFLFLLLLLLFL